MLHKCYRGSKTREQSSGETMLPGEVYSFLFLFECDTLAGQKLLQLHVCVEAVSKCDSYVIISNAYSGVLVYINRG